MKRTFVDLHIFLNTKDSSRVQRVLKKAASIGYSLVAVPFSQEARETEIVNFRKICTDLNLDFASRVDVAPRTRGQLMHLLRKLRRKFEVVCVVCENKEVARQAAKDRRVDLLSFPSSDYKKRFFDWAEAELASNSLAALEIDIKPLLLLEGTSRIRLLAALRREVSIAKEYHVPVVVSSGVETEILLRKPREIAAMISLLSVEEVEALNMVSTNPHEIVVRNREKLSRGFVAPGIRVVRERGDC